jgi:hypothetical protein
MYDFDYNDDYSEDGFLEDEDGFYFDGLSDDGFYDDWVEEDIIEGEFIIEEIEPFVPVGPSGEPARWGRVAPGGRFDPLIAVALLMALFVIFNVARDRGSAWASDLAGVGQVEASATGGAVQAVTPQLEVGDPEAFGSPYEHYTLTQGLHGYSYGHMAIDITAGEGAEILSPIHGEVVGLYVDWLGNTTLEIENQVYMVTMLHGLYTVELGDRVELGQVVGTESNQGNTYDMAGRSCRGRDCGYHTHLNVYDKRLGGNVNPLDLIDNE